MDSDTQQCWEGANSHYSVSKVQNTTRNDRNKPEEAHGKHAKSTQKEKTESLCHPEEFSGDASSFHGILFIHPLAILALHPSTDTQHVQDDSEKVGEG